MLKMHIAKVAQLFLVFAHYASGSAAAAASVLEKIEYKNGEVVYHYGDAPPSPHRRGLGITSPICSEVVRIVSVLGTGATSFCSSFLHVPTSTVVVSTTPLT